MRMRTWHIGIGMWMMAWLLCLPGPRLWAQPDPNEPPGPAAAQQAPQMTDIHDLKPLAPVPVPMGTAQQVGILAGALIVAALAALGWRLWRRKKTAPLPVAAPLSAEETALAHLNALSAMGQAEAKAFYFQLSAVFREYLHGRFALDGLEMTTEELLPGIERLPIPPALKGGAKRLLVSSDPVKFAGAPADQTTMDRDRSFVVTFVKETTPVPFREGAMDRVSV